MNGLFLSVDVPLVHVRTTQGTVITGTDATQLTEYLMVLILLHQGQTPLKTPLTLHVLTQRPTQ